MSYEAFEMKKKRMPEEATISILKQGGFGINRRAEELFRGAKFVSLHFDRAGRKIGFRPEERKTPHAYELRGGAGQGAMQVSGAAFLRYFGIEHKESSAYPCQWNDQENLVEIQLGK